MPQRPGAGDTTGQVTAMGQVWLCFTGRINSLRGPRPAGRQLDNPVLAYYLSHVLPCVPTVKLHLHFLPFHPLWKDVSRLQRDRNAETLSSQEFHAFKRLSTWSGCCWKFTRTICCVTWFCDFFHKRSPILLPVNLVYKAKLPVAEKVRWPGGVTVTTS